MANQYLRIPLYGDRHWKAPVEAVLDLPSNAEEGDFRFVKATGELYYYNGTIWQSYASGGGGSVTIQTDLGTSPVGSTFTFTSSSSLDITGNAITDTVAFEVKASYIRGLFSASSPLSYNSTTGAFTIDLSAYVQNTRTISSGSGLSGGGDLSANRTLSVDINGQTEDTTPDLANDFVMTYDASASGLKKVKLSNISSVKTSGPFYGDGSDGDLTINTDTTLSTLGMYNKISLSGNSRLIAPYPVVAKEVENVSGNNFISFNGNDSTGTSGGANLTGFVSGNIWGTSGGLATTTTGNSGSTGLSGRGIGGAGGAGGNSTGSGGAGGAGGTLSPISSLNGGLNVVKTQLFSSNPTLPQSNNYLQGGTGGGAGAPDGGGGGGTQGGGGGGGGGILMLKVKKFTITAGTLELAARGGNGNNAFGAQAGGGGGGGGGAICCISTTDITATSGLSTSVAGGNGGTGSNNGSAGSSGNVIFLLDSEEV